MRSFKALRSAGDKGAGTLAHAESVQSAPVVICGCSNSIVLISMVCTIAELFNALCRQVIFVITGEVGNAVFLDFDNARGQR